MAASSSGPGSAGAGLPAPSAATSWRLCETPSAAAAARGRRSAEMRRPGQRERAGGGEAEPLADDDVGPRAAHGAGESLDAEAGVGDDDDRADAEARVEDGGERRAGLDEQRDAVAAAHADLVQSGGDAAGLRLELAPADATRAPARHVDHGDVVVAGALVEPVPQRHEAAAVAGRAGPRAHCADRVEAIPAGRAVTRGGLRLLLDERGGGQPLQHRRGVRLLLRDQVARALVAVHVGVRQPVDQVVEVAVAEDRVLGPPLQQRRHLQPGDARADARRARRSSRAPRPPGCRRRTRRCRRGARRRGRARGTRPSPRARAGASRASASSRGTRWSRPSPRRARRERERAAAARGSARPPGGARRC